MMQSRKAKTQQLTSVCNNILQRKCACGQHIVAGGECAECRKKREVLQRTAVDHHHDPQTAPPIVHEVLHSSGRPIDPATRAYMEPRFGHDFSQVRVHTDDKAAESARAVNALAYTVGQNVAFGAGQYMPRTQAGRQLLAHELTHVVQQRTGTKTLQKKDAICKGYDDKGKISGVESVIARLNSLNADEELMLIQNLKWIIRCNNEAKKVEIQNKLSKTRKGKAIWANANTAFGGYTGMYPGYAPDMKKRLKGLGASETFKFEHFNFGETDAKDSRRSRAKYRARATKRAEAQTDELNRTDILYFRGHSYGRYKSPGMFADFKTESKRVDLRYLEQSGGFKRVKFVVSTSCATLCKEALAVFTPTFPNAVLLGYGGGAPKGGDVTRNAFEAKLKSLGKGLLLNQSADVDTVVNMWKEVIESRHKKRDAGRKPGFYRNGMVHYWDGNRWYTPSSNKCYVKEDFGIYFPGPLPKPGATGKP